MTPTAHTRIFVALTALVATALGLAATWHYAGLDLTLSHYDAKAHLVVARRIFDSLTPGWRQVGAVWLPLPHVLNALPVQVDAWYQHGTSGVAMSLISFVAAIGALVWWVQRATGAGWAAIAAAAVFLVQPDLLYLQATPMTEPLLLGLTVGGVVLLAQWADQGGRARAWPAGLGLALACLTRYEAWPITVASLGVATLVLWRGQPTAFSPASSAGPRFAPRVQASSAHNQAAAAGRFDSSGGSTLHDERQVSLVHALARVMRVGVWPLGAFLGFLVLSKATVGAWLVTGGFYVAENPAHGDPMLALTQVAWGLGQIAGWPVTFAAGAGALVALAAGLQDRSRQHWWFAVALAGCAALPFYAFVSGHPFRIRYMVPLIASAAACSGLLVGALPRRFRWAGGLAVLVLVAVERRPFDADAPMVVEAQWDRANQRERREVTACLKDAWQGEPILVSMGALAHYMQELSHDGFVLRHFVHEGIGELWFECLDAPARHVGFVLVEERAEGGDLFTDRLAADPSYFDRFERTCEGGGVALYVRR